MGLGTREGKLNFLQVKSGGIFMKDDPTEYQNVEGTVIGIRYNTSEFEGKKIETMNINVLSDDGETYVFPVRISSRSWATVCGALVECDIKRPITLNVGGEEYTTSKGEKKVRTFIWITQDGETVKSIFRKDNAEAIGLPEWKQVKVGKEMKWDNSEWEDFIRDYIDDVIKKLPAAGTVTKRSSVPAGVSEVEEEYEENAEETPEPPKTARKTSAKATTTKTPVSKKTTPPPVIEEDDEDSDLPF